MRELTEYLRSVGSNKLYRKGSSIFFQGEIPRQSILILDGTVKAFTLSKDGTESIIHLFGRGSVVPAAWTNNQTPTALFNYDAINDVRALAFRKQDLFDALDKNVTYANEYRDNLARAQAALLIRVTGLAQNRAIDKICYALYYLMFRYGIEKQPGMFEIDLKITQGMIAQLIGQTRESTAKNLKTLKKQNVVDYSSSTYVVNKAKLESCLGEDSFRNLAV